MLKLVRTKFAELRTWLGPTAQFLLAMTFLLAVFVSIWGWQTPIVRSIEMGLFNLRYLTVLGVAEEDDRITMLVYTEETARDTGRFIPVDRTLLAEALPAIDAAGPEAVIVDIVFASPTDDDEALLAALVDMRSPTYLATVDQTTSPDISPMRDDFRADFGERLLGTNVSFVDARLQTGDDDSVTHWPIETGLPLLANATAASGNSFASYGGPIRYRTPVYEDSPVFTRLPIDWFADPVMAEAMQDFIAGRIVLIGVDYAGFDRISVPFPDPISGMAETSGLDIHAHMISQRLDGVRYAEPPGRLGGALIFIILVSAILLGLFIQNRWLHIAGAVAILAIFLVLPFAVQMVVPFPTFGLPAAGPLIGGALIVFALVTVRRSIAWEKGRVAQFALSRYLPPDIATEILSRPSDEALSGDRRMIFTVFTDMEGFTDLCHRNDAGYVASLLNAYLETLSAVVIDHGGTIDKYVGDALVAIWGAPVARDDDGVRAYRAAIALQQAGEAFRSDPQWADANVGRTRVGMHYGEAIVGNFGGKDRIQYTALGDTMNVAARLEAANKELGTKILVSDAAIDQLPGSQCRTMGSIYLRGRATPVIVFEPVPEMDPDDFDRLEALHRRAMEGDPEAIDELRALAPEDEALASFVERMGRIIEQRQEPD